MKKKRKDKKPGFRIIYDPYRVKENDSFDDMLPRYLDDADRVYKLNDLTFYKAFQIFDIFVGKRKTIVVLSTEIGNLRLGDVLLDNNSNEYRITEFEMFRMWSSIPDWYMKISFLALSGPEDNIGEYFAKWSDRDEG